MLLIQEEKKKKAELKKDSEKGDKKHATSMQGRPEQAKIPQPEKDIAAGCHGQ